MNGNKHPVEVAEGKKNKLRHVSLYAYHITNLHKCHHHHPSYLEGKLVIILDSSFQNVGISVTH